MLQLITQIKIELIILAKVCQNNSLIFRGKFTDNTYLVFNLFVICFSKFHNDRYFKLFCVMLNLQLIFYPFHFHIRKYLFTRW